MMMMVLMVDMKVKIVVYNDVDMVIDWRYLSVSEENLGVSMIDF